MATAGARRAEETSLPSAGEPGQSLFSRLLSLGPKLEGLADRERDQFPLWLPVGLILGVSVWFW